jgi:hypothetical protein
MHRCNETFPAARETHSILNPAIVFLGAFMRREIFLENVSLRKQAQRLEVEAEIEIEDRLGWRFGYNDRPWISSCLCSWLDKQRTKVIAFRYSLLAITWMEYRCLGRLTKDVPLVLYNKPQFACCSKFRRHCVFPRRENICNIRDREINWYSKWTNTYCIESDYCSVQSNVLSWTGYFRDLAETADSIYIPPRRRYLNGFGQYVFRSEG